MIAPTITEWLCPFEASLIKGCSQGACCQTGTHSPYSLLVMILLLPITILGFLPLFAPVMLSNPSDDSSPSSIANDRDRFPSI